MFDFVTVFRGVNNFLIPWGLVVMPGPIALPLDSLLLRGIAARPYFCLRGGIVNTRGVMPAHATA